MILNVEWIFGSFTPSRMILTNTNATRWMPRHVRSFVGGGVTPFYDMVSQINVSKHYCIIITPNDLENYTHLKRWDILPGDLLVGTSNSSIADIRIPVRFDGSLKAQYLKIHRYGQYKITIPEYKFLL